MTPTATQIAHSHEMLKQYGTDSGTYELDSTDVDMPIAILGKLRSTHHYEVSEWGELLAGELRRTNMRARFTLFIRGELVVVKTNQPIDVIAAVVTTYVEKLRNDLPNAISITFDAVLAERMSAIVSK